jgi:glucose/arabinose dehydrogenase
VIRGAHADTVELFAEAGLNKPFGIAFYPPGEDPQFLYVANTDGVIRFPYRNGDLKARGPVEKLKAQPSGGAGFLRSGGHWTRDIVFSSDGKKMYVSIGSRSNNSDDASEANRARIFEFNPDGTDQNVYAWGIRNAVGIAFRPGTNELWMSTNERDELGDDLPPDYISSAKPHGFYGWPWFYIGNHVDPHHKDQHVDLASKVIVPDVLVQAHSATLNLCFYTGEQFPAEYKGDIFAAFHGSWNRTRALVIKSCVCLLITRPAKCSANTKISLSASWRATAVFGVGLSGLPSGKTARCFSVKTATAPSGVSVTESKHKASSARNGGRCRVWLTRAHFIDPGKDQRKRE